jgi:hypothetical protein
MSTGVIVLIVVIAVVIVAAAAFAALRQRNSGLRKQFGPEYERELAAHDGDERETERVLKERVKQVEGLDVHPLAPADRERYLAQWTALQQQFVDEPAKAVVDADRLLSQALQDQGFPEEHQYAGVSVHHTDALETYRTARTAAERAAHGTANTEELRVAMMQLRDAFSTLVGSDSGRATVTTGKDVR